MVPGDAHGAIDVHGAEETHIVRLYGQADGRTDGAGAE
jgi:hypothetical protein